MLSYLAVVTRSLKKKHFQFLFNGVAYNFIKFLKIIQKSYEVRRIQNLLLYARGVQEPEYRSRRFSTGAGAGVIFGRVFFAVYKNCNTGVNRSKSR